MKEFLFSRFRSFRYAGNGIWIFFSTQESAKIHLVGLTLTIILGFVLVLERWEWVALGLTIGIVLASEAFNTAIEGIVDKISPDFDPKAGNIKDIAAGAVLLASFCAVVVGALIFVPRIWTLIFD